MRAVPAIDLARPTSVCCIAVLSSLGRFASLYLLVERGIGRSTRTGYFFEVSAKLQGRVGFFGLAVMFFVRDGLSTTRIGNNQEDHRRPIFRIAHAEQASLVADGELLWSELFSTPAQNFSREYRTIGRERDLVGIEVRPFARLRSRETAQDSALRIDLQ